MTVSIQHMANSFFRYTTQVRILAPVFIFVIPYMAYLTAEITSLSSIIAWVHFRSAWTALEVICGVFRRKLLQNRCLRNGDETIRQREYHDCSGQLCQVLHQNARSVFRNSHFHVSYCPRVRFCARIDPRDVDDSCHSTRFRSITWGDTLWLRQNGRFAAGIVPESNYYLRYPSLAISTLIYSTSFNARFSWDEQAIE